MIEGADGEVLLTREEFKEEFLHRNEDAVDKALADGVHVVRVNGKPMFPRYRCQAWYRGEGKPSPSADRAERRRRAKEASESVCTRRPAH